VPVATTDQPASADPSAGYRFPFSPYPSGWFRLLSCDELAPGALQPLRAFGRELVVFRGRDGVVGVLDAFCPHLGAHLGVEGRVNENTVECPFHGWRFDAAGRCHSIPGTDRIPRGASANAWSVREHAGQVMVWFHPDARPPEWELPEIPEFGSADWTAFHPGKRWTIRTHVQELAENGMDLAHFPYLHSQQTLEARTTSLELEGPLLVHRTYQVYNLFGVAKLAVDEVVGPLDVNLFGLGCFVNRATVRARIEMSYTFTFYPTPIDDQHVRFASFLAMRKSLPAPLTRLLIWKAIREGARTIDQDVPIWERKRYQAVPRLSDVDGPIMRFRRWARQFYEQTAEGEQVPVAEGAAGEDTLAPVTPVTPVAAVAAAEAAEAV
jgi:nitrite reductase/ring-hydroxylating ferredoxin subunit